MPGPNNPNQEHPSTYVVQDRSNEQEFHRLLIQDDLTTRSMGGVLPEQEHPERIQGVLDIGSGSGAWLLETARTYPHIARLVGVDVSSKFLGYARSQVEAQQLNERVEFLLMDALRLLEFPNNSFDLVNQRFGMSFLRTWDWPGILQEFQRVVEPGGIVRITEADILGEEYSSPALLRLGQLLVQALYGAGHIFTPDKRGLTDHLERLLHQSGLERVQTRYYTLEQRAGTPEGELLRDEMKLLYRTITPFLHKWTRVPADYEETYQQMLKEIQQPDFYITGRSLTVWGTKKV